MENPDTIVQLQLPSEVMSRLEMKSSELGMDESSYAAKVIIEYLRKVGEEAGKGVVDDSIVTLLP
jgi:predicted DNA-binding protein